MKTFKKLAAQGDVMFKRIDELPDGLVEAEKQNGKYTVAHSETGHNHTVLEREAKLLIDKTNEFIAYLKVDEEAVLTHERSFDTHESIKFDKGFYEVRKQREYTPEGYRRAAD
jgi:F0F1-type ATP synthase membrane subunit b/b'